MAALAAGESTLIGASESKDSEALIAALRRFGVAIGVEPGKVHVGGGNLTPFRGVLDVGPAGTTSRFLTALAAGIDGAEVELRGTDRLHERPIGVLVDALRQVGASIEYLGAEGSLPLRILGRRLVLGDPVALDGSVSSQFFTALLLIAPLVEGGLQLRVRGTLVSRSYLEMTLAGLRDFGIDAHGDPAAGYRVAPGAVARPTIYRVEGDGTGATYFWSLAAISRGTIRSYNTPRNSLQGDMSYPDLLEEMGCVVRDGVDPEKGPWIEVQGGPLRAISCDMSLLPDAAQSLAVVAAVAHGRSTITGLSTLRVKETDRLAALRVELGKIGIRAEVGDDSLVVEGGVPHPARIATYEDHRMAMAFAPLGAVVDGLEIEEPSVVAKSFPTFWSALSLLGLEVSA
jgi:3-phosphoshikimate 1-carboxyvinyltransferase